MPNPIDIQVRSSADIAALQQTERGIKGVNEAARQSSSEAGLAGMTGQIQKASAAYGRVIAIAGRVTSAISAISAVVATGAEAWALYGAKAREALSIGDARDATASLFRALNDEVQKRKQLGTITKDQADNQLQAIAHARDLQNQRLITDQQYLEILRSISKELIEQTTIPKRSSAEHDAERRAQLEVMVAGFKVEEAKLKDSLDAREITIEQYRKRLEQIAQEIAAKESSILMPGLTSPEAVARIKAAADLAKTQLDLQLRQLEIRRLKGPEEEEVKPLWLPEPIVEEPQKPEEDKSFGAGVSDFMTKGLVDLENQALIASEVLTGTLGAAVDGLSASLTGLVFKSGDWGRVWAQTTQRIIGSLIQMGVQMVAQFALAKVHAMITGTAITASMTPAAVVTGAATYGSNAAGVGLVIAAIIAGLGALAFAEGGMVPGAPSHRDNRLAQVASGEYIHRTAAVQYYGPAIMEALNRRMIPRDVLESLTMPSPRFGSHAFAAGGMVADMAAASPQSINVAAPKVTVGVLNSRSELRDFMESSEGQVLIYDATRRRTMDMGIRA